MFENNNEVGVFARVTNAYALCGIGGSENFYSVFESELADHIPVVKASIAGTRIVGRMCVGNRNGLLLPHTTTDQARLPPHSPKSVQDSPPPEPCLTRSSSAAGRVQEMLHIRNCLPDRVVVQRVEERLSALGNCVASNDYVALVHTDLDRDTEEIIADVLGVDTFRQVWQSRSGGDHALGEEAWAVRALLCIHFQRLSHFSFPAPDCRGQCAGGIVLRVYKPGGHRAPAHQHRGPGRALLAAAGAFCIRAFYSVLAAFCLLLNRAELSCGLSPSSA